MGLVVEALGAKSADPVWAMGCIVVKSTITFIVNASGDNNVLNGDP